ncbi:unnamed protein product [Cyprideis torosa]|uniref:Uncharacterized protein n=1 Tax=Cyprideis torosa TaxID=163714 RepID=A0A7R8W6I5_9CRUS|nr:unnamed protein product [Cyprideis torosa]CAG0881800.1 unnamed protein product [Cyprideis torosa]
MTISTALAARSGGGDDGQSSQSNARTAPSSLVMTGSVFSIGSSQQQPFNFQIFSQQREWILDDSDSNDSTPLPSTVDIGVLRDSDGSLNTGVLETNGAASIGSMKGNASAWEDTSYDAEGETTSSSDSESSSDESYGSDDSSPPSSRVSEASGRHAKADFHIRETNFPVGISRKSADCSNTSSPARVEEPRPPIPPTSHHLPPRPTLKPAPLLTSPTSSTASQCKLSTATDSMVTVTSSLFSLPADKKPPSRPSHQPLHRFPTGQVIPITASPLSPPPSVPLPSRRNQHTGPSRSKLQTRKEQVGGASSVAVPSENSSGPPPARRSSRVTTDKKEERISRIAKELESLEKSVSGSSDEERLEVLDGEEVERVLAKSGPGSRSSDHQVIFESLEDEDDKSSSDLVSEALKSLEETSMKNRPLRKPAPSRLPAPLVPLPAGGAKPPTRSRPTKVPSVPTSSAPSTPPSALRMPFVSSSAQPPPTTPSLRSQPRPSVITSSSSSPFESPSFKRHRGFKTRRSHRGPGRPRKAGRKVKKERASTRQSRHRRESSSVAPQASLRQESETERPQDEQVVDLYCEMKRKRLSSHHPELQIDHEEKSLPKILEKLSSAKIESQTPPAFSSLSSDVAAATTSSGTTAHVHHVTASCHASGGAVTGDESAGDGDSVEEGGSSSARSGKRRKKSKLSGWRSKHRNIVDPVFLAELEDLATDLGKTGIPQAKPGEIHLPSIFCAFRYIKGRRKVRSGERQVKESEKRRRRAGAGNEDSSEQRLPLKKRHRHIVPLSPASNLSPDRSDASDAVAAAHVAQPAGSNRSKGKSKGKERPRNDQMVRRWSESSGTRARSSSSPSKGGSKDDSKISQSEQVVPPITLVGLGRPSTSKVKPSVRPAPEVLSFSQMAEESLRMPSSHLPPSSAPVCNGFAPVPTTSPVPCDPGLPPAASTGAQDKKRRRKINRTGFPAKRKKKSKVPVVVAKAPVKVGEERKVALVPPVTRRPMSPAERRKSGESPLLDQKISLKRAVTDRSPVDKAGSVSEEKKEPVAKATPGRGRPRAQNPSTEVGKGEECLSHGAVKREPVASSSTDVSLQRLVVTVDTVPQAPPDPPKQKRRKRRRGKLCGMDYGTKPRKSALAKKLKVETRPVVEVGIPAVHSLRSQSASPHRNLSPPTVAPLSPDRPRRSSAASQKSPLSSSQKAATSEKPSSHHKPLSPKPNSLISADSTSGNPPIATRRSSRPKAPRKRSGDALAPPAEDVKPAIDREPRASTSSKRQRFNSDLQHNLRSPPRIPKIRIKPVIKPPEELSPVKRKRGRPCSIKPSATAPSIKTEPPERLPPKKSCRRQPTAAEGGEVSPDLEEDAPLPLREREPGTSGAASFLDALSIETGDPEEEGSSAEGSVGVSDKLPKKKYAVAGLFSRQYKVNPDSERLPVPSNGSEATLPPPAYCSRYLRQTKRPYTLPYDLAWLHRSDRLPKRTTGLPSWNYKKIRTNVYFGVKPMLQEMHSCNCVPPTDSEELGCGEMCLNRLMLAECQKCACGSKCSNQKIQKHQWHPGIQRFMTDRKGFGVKTRLPIKKGEFILEYLGEVVTETEFKRRMNEIYQNDTHHYCLNLDRGLVIDGHRMGGEGRFVNHSCDPNCEMHKWLVSGLYRMALFAKRDIEKEEELSYDYNFSLFNPSEGQPCHCGGENCRGVIGGKTAAKVNNQNGSEGSEANKRSKEERKNSGSKKIIVPLKPLPPPVAVYVAKHRIFLLRNYHQIRRHRDALIQKLHGTEPSSQTPKVDDAFLTHFNALHTSRSVRTRQLAHADEDPEISRTARLAQVFKEICAAVTTAKDEEGQELAKDLMVLPSKKQYPGFYNVISEAMDLSTIQKNILRGHYKDVQTFDDDFTLLFEGYQRFFGYNSKIGQQAQALKRIFQETKLSLASPVEDILGELPQSFKLPLFQPIGNDVIRCPCEIIREEGLMIQCEKCNVWQHCECVGMSTAPDHYLCELCGSRAVPKEIPCLPLEPSPSPTSNEPVHFYVTLQREDGLTLRMTEYMYVMRDVPKEEQPEAIRVARETYENGGFDHEKYDIFCIEKLWKTTNGERMAFGHHFLRPNETYHEASRRFYPNEVMRVPLYEVIPIRLLVGQCWVLDPALYIRGRPLEAKEEHVFICEYRVDKRASIFTKSKTKFPPCTKSFAFFKFENKLKITRTLLPHQGGPRIECRNGCGRKREKKTEANKQDALKAKQPRPTLESVLQRLLAQMPVNQDPVDLSYLLDRKRIRRRPDFLNQSQGGR